jgi:HSP20 family protein
MATLVKFNPTAPVAFNNFVDQFFNRNIANFIGADAAITNPSVNVIETKEAFRLEVAAPGLEKQDFKLHLEKDILTISAQKEHKEEVKEERFTRREFNFSAFKRSFTLPEHVDVNGINAAYNNGVLSINLPKKEEVINNASRAIEVV